MYGQQPRRRSQAVFCAAGVIGIDFASKFAAQRSTAAIAPAWSSRSTTQACRSVSFRPTGR